MWFMFPQIKGLGFSVLSKRYAIKHLQEAEAYLAHKVLGKRLVELCEVLMQRESKTAFEIFGNPDEAKLKSCMTLFSKVENASGIFEQVLAKYFNGEKCQKTLQILNEEKS